MTTASDGHSLDTARAQLADLRAERDAIKARCERLIELLRKANDYVLIDPVDQTRPLGLEAQISAELDSIDKEMKRP